MEECIDFDELQDALASLPKTLDETYSRILSQIVAYPEKRRKKAIQILQFLVYSDRPLTGEEAVDAVAVNVDKFPSFHPTWRMPNHRDIARICSSLVSIVTRKPSDYKEDEVIELHLAYLTVKEYLMSGRVEEIFQKGFTEFTARGTLTRVCLAYLSHVDTQDSVRQVRKKFPLAQYSAEYWMTHARSAETDKAAQHSIMDFFRGKSPGYAVWRQLYDPDHPWREVREVGRKGGNPLYYSSQAGLKNTTELLLHEGADVNAAGGDYGSALQAASTRGYQDIVQLLLDNRANVNAEGGYHGSALHLASAGGYQDIVQLLLDNGANVTQEVIMGVLSREPLQEDIRILYSCSWIMGLMSTQKEVIMGVLSTLPLQEDTKTLYSCSWIMERMSMQQEVIMGVLSRLPLQEDIRILYSCSWIMGLISMQEVNDMQRNLISFTRLSAYGMIS